MKREHSLYIENDIQTIAASLSGDLLYYSDFALQQKRAIELNADRWILIMPASILHRQNFVRTPPGLGQDFVRTDASPLLLELGCEYWLRLTRSLLASP